MLPGQVLEDFAAHAPAIASALGVSRVRVVPLGPGRIRLDLLSGDTPLGHPPVTWSPPAPSL